MSVPHVYCLLPRALGQEGQVPHSEDWSKLLVSINWDIFFLHHVFVNHVTSERLFSSFCVITGDRAARLFPLDC